MSLLDFVRQSIASSNVQWTIEHVVGLLTATATIEGFEKKLGEKILEKGLKDLNFFQLFKFFQSFLIFADQSIDSYPEF
jgi:hypothetical protein